MSDDRKWFFQRLRKISAHQSPLTSFEKSELSPQSEDNIQTNRFISLVRCLQHPELNGVDRQSAAFCALSDTYDRQIDIAFSIGGLFSCVQLYQILEESIFPGQLIMLSRKRHVVGTFEKTPSKIYCYDSNSKTGEYKLTKVVALIVQILETFDLDMKDLSTFYPFEIIIYNVSDKPQINPTFKSAVCYPSVTRLLENFNLNLSGIDGANALSSAIKAHCNEAVKFYLTQSASPNALDDDKKTALRVAVAFNNYRAIPLLVKGGANVNQRFEDLNFETPLHLAVALSNFTSCLALLKEGADPTAVNSKLKTPADFADTMGTSSQFTAACEAAQGYHLRLAAARGDLNLLEKILKHKDKLRFINQAGEESNKTALHFAVKNNHKDCAELLLSHGSNPNSQDKKGDTPFHIACREKNTQLINLFINAKAWLAAENEQKETPTKMIENLRHTDKNLLPQEVVGELQENQVEYLKKEGQALRLAAARGEVENINRIISSSFNGHFLLDAGGEKTGNRAIHFATQYDHIHVVNLLVQFNANVQLPNFEGNTPLLLACQLAHHDIVRLLLFSDANVFFKDAKGNYPVILIKQLSEDYSHPRQRRFINLLPLLKKVQLQQGVRLGKELRLRSKQKDELWLQQFFATHKASFFINSQGPTSGKSPLHFAVESQSTQCVRQLLCEGADVNLCNFSGVSSLDVALHTGPASLIALMKMNGADLERSPAVQSERSPGEWQASMSTLVISNNVLQGMIAILESFIDHNTPLWMHIHDKIAVSTHFFSAAERKSSIRLAIGLKMFIEIKYKPTYEIVLNEIQSYLTLNSRLDNDNSSEKALFVSCLSTLKNCLLSSSNNQHTHLASNSK
jgi:ankyrin repeat protein